MVEEKKELWLNYLASTTVILAVCATLSTFKGGSFSTRAVLTQSHTANQWAYYQAKNIEGYLHELEKEKLELELKVMGSKATKSIVDDYKKKIESYSKNIKRYDEEKAQIQKEAKKYEALHDDAQKNSGGFLTSRSGLWYALHIVTFLKVRIVARYMAIGAGDFSTLWRAYSSNPRFRSYDLTATFRLVNQLNDPKDKLVFPMVAFCERTIQARCLQFKA